MKRSNTIIAIDGYSSCGKSTLAKALASTLGYLYIDSGAMYRAVTLYFIRENTNLSQEDEVKKMLEDVHIDLHHEDGKLIVLLNDEDISEEIRQMPVSELVSEVSALKPVRQAMVALQQGMGKRKNIIMDGRDIGTTVFPDADLKLFMIADPNVRAQRRYKELLSKGEKVTLEEVFENIAHRDYIDTTRAESPLSRAPDAVVLDNTDLNEEQQLQFVLDRLGTP